MTRLALMVFCALLLAGQTSVVAQPDRHVLRGATIPVLDPRGDMDQEFALAQLAGADVFRTSVGWPNLEPHAKGVYDRGNLGLLDRAVADARQAGLKAIIGLVGSPCWAQAGPCHWWSPPADPADYGDMLAFLAARYGAAVLAWEVWNEPNQATFWGESRPDPERYTALLKAARARAPQAFILAGALGGSDVSYLSRMYEAGAIGQFDALSLHPYVWMDPAPGGSPDDCSYLPMSFACGVPNVRATMLKYGDSRDIWFTEFGWSTHNVDEATQAAYVHRAYELVADWEYVPVAILYTLLDRRYFEASFSLDDRECCFGLFRADASRKPAADALLNAPVP